MERRKWHSPNYSKCPTRRLDSRTSQSLQERSILRFHRLRRYHTKTKWYVPCTMVHLQPLMLGNRKETQTRVVNRWPERDCEEYRVELEEDWMNSCWAILCFQADRLSLSLRFDSKVVEAGKPGRKTEVVRRIVRQAFITLPRGNWRAVLNRIGGRGAGSRHQFLEIVLPHVSHDRNDVYYYPWFSPR